MGLTGQCFFCLYHSTNPFGVTYITSTFPMGFSYFNEAKELNLYVQIFVTGNITPFYFTHTHSFNRQFDFSSEPGVSSGILEN